MKYMETVKTARREIWGAICGGAGNSASVSIMEKEAVVYSECFGVADREENKPVDKTTRFDIASVSKMFTTSAALILVDMGKLDIDRPIIEYIKDFEMNDPRHREITARMLFNHSSGLAGSCYNQAFCFEEHGDYQRHVLDAMKRARLKHAPGEKSSYCNDGFTLAEILVERVSGQKFMDFIAERILSPLGLKNTGISVGALNAKNTAEIYEAETLKKLPLEVSAGTGTGGISSTPEDLCLFGQSFCANASKRFLSEASLRLILTPQTSAFSDKLRTRQQDCNMGWDANILDKYEKRGVRVLYKGGLTWYSTRLFVLPEMDVSLALTFSGGGPCAKPSLAILDAFLEEKGLGSFRVTVKKPPASQPVPPDMNRFAGFYSDGSTAVEIVFDSKEITIKPLTGKEETAVFIYNGTYFYKKDDNNPIPHYFAESGGMCFFAAENEYNADLVYQKIEYQNRSKILDWDIDGKTWLNINMKVRQLNWNNMFVVKSKLIGGLPGYIDFAGIKKIEDGKFAAAAGTYFRDQKDLFLEEENGVLTAYCADYILRPEETFPVLDAGQTNVSVPNSDLNALWYKTKDGYILTIETEADVTAQVISPDGKTTIYASYMSTIPNEEFYAPKDSYIVFYGKNGGSGKICAR